MDPAAPARHADLQHARQKETTRSNQKQELPTTGQTPKAHGIGAEAAAGRMPLAQELGRVKAELERLRASLREHGIEPDDDAA